MTHYLELAVGSPRNRGNFIEKNDYINTVYETGKETALYRSVYLYDESGFKEISSKGTVKNYFGIRYIDMVPIDIDKGDNTHDYTLRKAQAIVFEIEEAGLDERNYQIYYSGTGYHIDINKDCFGFEPGEDLPYIVKETMQKLNKEIDTSIYMRSGIYRCEHTINHKSNLFKIPLTRKELFSLKSEVIREMAKTRRLDFNYQEKYGDGELIHLLKKDVPEIKVMQKISEPITIVPCIQKMYNEGSVEGSRNNKILRMASHFKRNGIPSMATKAALLAWNNHSLEEQLIVEKVESVYNSNYKYGCNDVLMKEYCNPKCIHFKRKDYLIDIKNSDALQKDLEERFSTDWTGKVINLTTLFGLPPSIDCTVYPGELMTIFGPTGTNKTALAQNIALSFDMANRAIRDDLRVSTLYLSLELSGWTIHRRNLQIVSNQDKEEIKETIKETYAKHKKHIDHIMVQTVAPTMKQIEEKIKEVQPCSVIVDYIDLIDTPYKDEYGHVKFVSHKLRSLAVNLDVIIIQLSQISRDYSRKQILDLYAGKGSGGIENASSKVIGITGQQNEVQRKIELFKNTDGDLFEANLIWTPSYRMVVE